MGRSDTENAEAHNAELAAATAWAEGATTRTRSRSVGDLRALTLTQPWAGLVASGIKLVENREQGVVKAVDFGNPFAIHASREIDNDVYDRIKAIAPELFTAEAYKRWYWLSRITSAVLATGAIDRVIRAKGISSSYPGTAYTYDREALDELGEQRRWLFGRYGYVIADAPRVLPTPVPCRGWQGFWRVPGDVVAKVEEQLR